MYPYEVHEEIGNQGQGDPLLKAAADLYLPWLLHELWDCSWLCEDPRTGSQQLLGPWSPVSHPQDGWSHKQIITTVNSWLLQNEDWLSLLLEPSARSIRNV